MEKRGASNIEFVLAFVLFAGFVVAILYMFNPASDTRSMEFSRDYVTNEIIRNSSIDMDSYSVKITAPSSIEIDGVGQNQNARVEDYYGKVLDSRLVWNNGKAVVSFSRTNENFVVIYFSEDFDRGTFDQSPVANSNHYQIASSIKNKVVSEKRILGLNRSYHSDYELLKRQLGIPGNVDFSFELEFPDNGIINAERSTPLRTEVFSSTKIVEVLRANGDSMFGYLRVAVW